MLTDETHHAWSLIQHSENCNISSDRSHLSSSISSWRYSLWGLCSETNCLLLHCFSLNCGTHGGHSSDFSNKSAWVAGRLKPSIKGYHHTMEVPRRPPSWELNLWVGNILNYSCRWRNSMQLLWPLSESVWLCQTGCSWLCCGRKYNCIVLYTVIATATATSVHG